MEIKTIIEVFNTNIYIFYILKNNSSNKSRNEGIKIRKKIKKLYRSYKFFKVKNIYFQN